jgi:hypothetical protein
MLLHFMSSLLLLAQAAAQGAPPPPAAAPAATPPASAQVDLHAIAQALGSAKKVPQASQKCGETAKDQQRRSAIGVLGSIGGMLLPVPGVGGAVAALALPATVYLTDKLLTMLDCNEQQQASKATQQAIRGGVGTEVSWKSETRPNVAGRSKVTAQQKLADGSQCLTVTDVVIVEGEETTVPKRMCRASGASGFVRV